MDLAVLTCQSVELRQSDTVVCPIRNWFGSCNCGKGVFLIRDPYAHVNALFPVVLGHICSGHGSAIYPPISDLICFQNTLDNPSNDIEHHSHRSRLTGNFKPGMHTLAMSCSGDSITVPVTTLVLDVKLTRCHPCLFRNATRGTKETHHHVHFPVPIRRHS